ncbi:MAG TPA: hypothetical protein PKI14_18360 [Fervidobacterium sp.]|nr:hypothetical protein [Fervidobacterium sp.]
MLNIERSYQQLTVICDAEELSVVFMDRRTLDVDINDSVDLGIDTKSKLLNVSTIEVY